MIWAAGLVLVAGWLLFDLHGKRAASPSSGTVRVAAEALPAAPLDARERASGVWTGKEAIYWGGRSGGQTDTRFFADGAAYDPSAGRWRRIAPAPLSARSGHTAVWTGREMVIWGGRADQGRTLSDGAAYDPARDRWHRLPSAPQGAGREYGKAIWFRNLLIVGAGADSGDAGRTLLAYSPAARRWRTFELARQVYDLAAGDRALYALTYDRRSRAVAVTEIRPLADETRVLPEPPADGPPDGLGLTWSGDRLLLTLGTETRSRVLQFSRGHWSPAGSADAADFHPPVSPGMDPQARFSAWTGHSLLNYSPNGLESYVPRAGAVQRIEGRYGRERGYCGAGAAVVWTGSEIISWSGQSCRTGADPQTATGLRITVTYPNA
jgi:hypothetical protein